MINIDFSGMLQAYEVDVSIETTNTGSNGGYDEETGEWTPSTPSTSIKEDFRAVVLPYTQNELYQAAGRLTSQSRKMITNRVIETKSTITCGTNKYSVEGVTDYTNFSNFYEYELKWVSAFDNLL